MGAAVRTRHRTRGARLCHLAPPAPADRRGFVPEALSGDVSLFPQCRWQPESQRHPVEKSALGRRVATHRQRRAGCLVQRARCARDRGQGPGSRQPWQPVAERPGQLQRQGTRPFVHRLQALAGLWHAATVVGRDRHGADPRHPAGPGDARQALGPGADASR